MKNNLIEKSAIILRKQQVIENARPINPHKEIYRFGYAKNVLIIKAHRHFDLNPDEAMLELPVGDDGSSINSPVPLEDIIKQKEEILA